MIGADWVRRAAGSLPATVLVIVAVSAAAVGAAAAAVGLRLSGALGLYFVIWWTLVFAVLPFGHRSQAEAGEVAAGTDPGAPSLPGLPEKAIWTTLIAAAALVGASWLLPLAGL